MVYPEVLSSSAPSGAMDRKAPEKPRQAQGWGDASVLPRKRLKPSKHVTLTMVSAHPQNIIFKTLISITVDIDSIISHADHLTPRRISQMPRKELMWAMRPPGRTVCGDYQQGRPSGLQGNYPDCPEKQGHRKSLLIDTTGICINNI